MGSPALPDGRQVAGDGEGERDDSAADVHAAAGPVEDEVGAADVFVCESTRAGCQSRPYKSLIPAGVIAIQP